jgi:hypothetical protein
MSISLSSIIIRNGINGRITDITIINRIYDYSVETSSLTYPRHNDSILNKAARLTGSGEGEFNRIVISVVSRNAASKPTS